MKVSISAIAAACSMLSCSMAAPITFDYVGTFTAANIPDPFQPSNIDVSFSGTITIDTDETGRATAQALVSSIDSFTVGSMTFDSSNVFAHISYDPTVGSNGGALGFTIGDVTSGTSSLRDDFFFVFASDNAASLSDLVAYDNARPALTLSISNVSLNSITNTPGTGSVRLTAQLAEVPIPAVGLSIPILAAGFAWTKRRRQKKV